MDILEQYEKSLPQEPRQAPQWESSGEYGALIRLVMRFSGGRIQDERHANLVLIIAAVVIFGISILILINPGSNIRPSFSGKIINIPGQPPRLGPTIVPQP